MKITMLSESSSNIIDSVRENAFYKEYGGVLHKGVPTPRTAMFPFKERSVSLDTWGPYHNTVNAKSYDKFGINVRNQLFVSTSVSQARGYGETVYIVPVGHYRMFIASGYLDMTNSLYAYTQDVFKKIARFIENDLTAHLSVSPDFFDKFIVKAGPVSQLITATSRETFDIAGALAYVKTHVYDLVKDRLEFTGKLPDNFDSLMDKAFDVFYQEQFLSPTNHYVDSLVEVSDPSQLKEHDGEVMLYSPDGIYAITSDDFNWELG